MGSRDYGIFPAARIVFFHAPLQKNILFLLLTMDPLMLVTLRSAIKGCYQREAFDKVFSSCFPLDPDERICKVFNIIMKSIKSTVHPCYLMYSVTYGHDNGAKDDLMYVAAMAASVLPWQLHGSFLVHQRLNWQNHTRLLCCMRRSSRNSTLSPYPPLIYFWSYFVQIQK